MVVQVRRFTLADAMILVAAVAAGLAFSRAWLRCATERAMYSSAIFPRDSWPPLATVSRWLVQEWPLVAMMAPALLVLRARRPRPPRRRLFAPPGLVACAAVMIAMALEALANIVQVVLYAMSLGGSKNVLDEVGVLNIRQAALGVFSSTTIGIVVAAVWGSMALTGRWRPEPSWIDRAGRVIGWLWIALIPIRIHFNVVSPYLG
jgi:hypothetical protein